MLGAGAPNKRMSALGHEMRALVAREGPISVERFMALALGHPKYGYYMNRDPFGAAGDFTTAPEISQMFGELIGLWAAEVWGMAGRPKPAILIEFGPGRGTLMSDALRAARVAPDFRAALDVRLVETSPYLAAIQRETLLTSGAPISWCATIGEAPPGPAIILGNEFLDALPVRQFVFSRGVWRERLVDVGGDGRLAFVASDDPELGIRGAAKEGDIVEISPTAHRLVRDLAARIMGYGGAALFIDYGHVDRDRGHFASRARPPVGRPARRPGRSGSDGACRFRLDCARGALGWRRGARPDRPRRLLSCARPC